jgi:ABC-2 type transport system permease protein
MSAPTLQPLRRRSWPGLVASELRKTRSTSAWWALLIPAGLGGLLLGWVELPAPSLYFSLNLTQLFAVLFGVVCMSAEYRHRTITTSYLVVAARSRLMVSKMVLAAAVGAAYALVTTAMVIAGQLASGFPIGAELPSMLRAGAGAVPVLAIGAVLGVCLGAVIGKQLLSVLVSVLYLVVVEPVLVVLVDRPAVTTYLPGMAADTALGGLTGGAQFGGGFGVAQPWWVMVLVLAGWAAVFALAGAVAARRRDIA